MKNLKSILVTSVLSMVLLLTSFSASALLITQPGTGWNGQYTTIEAVSMPSQRIIAVYNEFNNGKWVIGLPNPYLTQVENDDINYGINYVRQNNQPHSLTNWFFLYNYTRLCFRVTSGNFGNSYCGSWPS